MNKMRQSSRLIALVLLIGFLFAGCASMKKARTAGLGVYPHDPWYSDLVPFSEDELTDWAVFDLGYPTMPDFNETTENPAYDLYILFR
ncbi:MAG TPA: hypothetical protein PLZ55_02190 [bacterium]|nr:hypothetical protein [bacterium]HPO07450.1 hypothetical protein [bacterium]